MPSNLDPNMQSYIVNKVALGGINTFDDPKDIDDTECQDLLNMVFDNGSISPREGSHIYAPKPVDEAGDPFQFLIPTTSDGIDYMIVNYGFNFYLWDTINNQWILLNQSFTPSSEYMYYGSTNWNNGITDDRFYFGNGMDDTLKWIMAVNELNVIANSGDTTLTLTDSTRFPQTLEVGVANITIGANSTVTFPNVQNPGTNSLHGLHIGSQITFQTTGALPTGITAGTTYFVIAAGFTTTSFQFSTSSGGTAVTTSGTQSGVQTVFTNTIPIIVQQTGGSAVNLFYTANDTDTGILTLQGSIGTTVAAGSTVTMPVLDMAIMPKGKVFTKFQDRLFIFNSYKAENTFYYSYLGDPENFSIDATQDSGGFYTIYIGRGGIVNVDNFGEYLVIEKTNVMLQLSFQYASDNSGFILQVSPLMSGESIGPVTNANSVNYMNTIYYTTQSEGIIGFNPTTTGTQSTPTLEVLSQKIQDYVVDTLNFTNGRTAGFNQKLFWLNAVPILAGITNTINNGVLMYDLLRNVWTRFDNWNAADIKPINQKLYYLNLNDGGVYSCFVDYQDDQSGNPYEYNCSFLTKRFDYATPQNLSRGSLVYIQGYISITTKFYVDALYNEGGYLGKQTYEINGNNSNIVQNNFTGGLGANMLDQPFLGGVTLDLMQTGQQPAFFRCYLELSQAYRYNNITLKFYSQELGAYWSPNNITIMWIPEPSIPTQMVLSPTLTPPVVL